MAKRKKSEKLVASVAAFDEDGKLLFGLRSDMQKWVLPGGHLEEDEEGNPEDPRKAAVRELREETGLKPLSLQYLGHGVVRRLTGNVRVFCFKARVAGKPHGDDDPDQECQTFRFVDVKNGIPDDINEHLRDKNNVTLRLLGLQEGEVRKHESEQDLIKTSGGDIYQIMAGPPPPTWQPSKADLGGYPPEQAEAARQLVWKNLSTDSKVSAWQYHDWKISRKPDESDADFLRRSPNPEDRAMGLKVPSTEKRHLMEAAANGDSSSFAKTDIFNHPLFDREVAGAMLRSRSMPAAWKQSALDQKKDPVTTGEVESLVSQFTPNIRPDRGDREYYNQRLSREESGLLDSLSEHPALSSDQVRRFALYGSDGIDAHIASRMITGRPQLPPETLHDIVKGATELAEKPDSMFDMSSGFRSAAIRSVLRRHDLPPQSFDHVLDYADKHTKTMGAAGGAADEMLRALSANPSLSTKHMVRMMNPKRTEANFGTGIQLAVLKNPRVDKEVIDTALANPKAEVRRAAIEQPHSSKHTPEQLERAAQDKDMSVRKAVASHPDASPELLQRIHDDFWNGISPDAKAKAMAGDLGQQAAINAYMSNISSAIVHNGNVSDELFRHIATHYMPSGPGDLHMDAVSNPYPTKAKLDALVEGLDNAAKLSMSHTQSLDERRSERLIHELIDSNPDNKNHWREMLTPDHLMSLLKNRIPSASMKATMLKDSGLPWRPEDLSAVVKGQHDNDYDSSGNDRMRAGAVRNPKTPIEAVREVLAGHTPHSDYVMQEAVRHPGLTGAELMQVADHVTHHPTLDALVQHPNAGPEHVSAAMRNNPMFAGHYLRHGDKVTLEHVKEGVRSQYYSVRAAAVGHPLAPIEDVRRIAFDPNEHYDARLSAMNTGRLSEEDLVQMANRPPTTDPLHPGAGVIDAMVPKAKELLAKEAPDTVFTEKVAPRLGVGKHRKIRDLITSKKGRMFMHQKELPPGDWSAGRGPDGNIHASKLQEHIDKQPTLPFNVSHAEWTGAQRHSDQPSQVFQLNLTSDHVRKMKAAGVYDAFRKMQAASTYSSHPVAKYHGIGWVRWTGSNVHENANPVMDDGYTRTVNPDGSVKYTPPPPGWTPKPKRTRPPEIFIDEVQSDFGQSFVRQAAAQAAAQGGDAEHAAQEAAKKYGSEEDYKKISQILFNGKHPNEVLHEAFQQWLRDKGHHNARVQVHTVESKAPISLGKKLPHKCASCGKSEEMHLGEVCAHPGCNHPKDMHHAFTPWTEQNPEECAKCSSRRLAEHHPDHEFKAGLGHPFEPGEVDRTKAPGHFNVTYHDVPKKMGAEPSSYGKLKTQSGNRDEHNIGTGAPTWEMRVRKFEHLTKMALGDIKPGKDMGPTHRVNYPWGHFERVDYTHLLKPEHQKAGYKLIFEHKDLKSDDGRPGKLMRAVITHPNASLGRNTTMNPGEAAQVTGVLHPDGRVQIGASDSDPEHRGGKGVALYEALLSHAKNKFGAHTVAGDAHSTLAMKVHSKLAEKHGMAYKPEENWGSGKLYDTKADWARNPTGPHDMHYRPYSYTLKAETWLAQHKLIKQIKPSDLKPVSKYHDGPLGETFVDHSNEFEAHPTEHQAHVDAFRSSVIDHPDHVKRGKTGTRESSNSTGKVVYDVEHEIGDDERHRFMVKPYHEKIVPRARPWMHFPIQGWAEMTNQALYHAGLIGHLHQKVHVAEVPMPAAGQKIKRASKEVKAQRQEIWRQVLKEHPTQYPTIDSPNSLRCQGIWQQICKEMGTPRHSQDVHYTEYDKRLANAGLVRGVDDQRVPNPEYDPAKNEEIDKKQMDEYHKRMREAGIHHEQLEHAPKAPDAEPEMAPALVIHMQPDVNGVRFMNSSHFSPDEVADVKKIGLMDFLTNNLDRHETNLLWDNANNRFLAIDHSRSFQYKGPDKGYDLTRSEKRQRETEGADDRLSHYIGSFSAIRKVDPKPVHSYLTRDVAGNEGTKLQVQDQDKLKAWNKQWDDTLQWWKKVGPAIKDKMYDRLNMIKDTNVRTHIKKNFDARAAHLDDLAKHGVENFGELDWDKTPVPMFPYR